jgi:hypothetical protein
MKPHDDDSSKFSYPPGIGHDTEVEVVIDHKGGKFLFRGKADQFGWKIEPHSAPGLNPLAAPITHYAILEAA